MKLRSQVEHAILCCLLMIDMNERETISTSEMARLFGLPKEYLSKTLQALSRSGILIGSHGTFGGYRLARDAQAIHLLDIAEAVEVTLDTFRQSGCVEKLFSGKPSSGAGRALGSSFSEADHLWRNALALTNLDILARTIGLTAEGLQRVRARNPMGSVE